MEPKLARDREEHMGGHYSKMQDREEHMGGHYSEIQDKEEHMGGHYPRMQDNVEQMGDRSKMDDVTHRVDATTLCVVPSKRKDVCVQAGFWVQDRGKNVMYTPRVILEPPDCLNGPGRKIGRKELFSVYNLCFSKGKATRCRYCPLLYASIGWGLPAGYTGGRCIELGDEPPIVYCVYIFWKPLCFYVPRCLC